MVAADLQRRERGGLEVIATPDALARGIDRLASGHGPVAVDTERASGYRYSDRAYLVQLFRRGSGTLLIDPLPFQTLAPVGEVIAGEEWILHAATQDLPSLRDAGLNPTEVFDTELAARLLGRAQVGLGAVVHDLLGIELAKAHSADDWSTRPLPEEWLAYAALDVELLIDVRDRLAADLDTAGKRGWADEEFADLLVRELGTQRGDRWRRLSGIHTLRGARQLAVARELWLARDAYAREIDTAPGRIVPDRALTAAAKAMPRSKRELADLKAFTGRQSRSQLDRWWAALEMGRATDDLPAVTVRDPDRIPQPRSWATKRPSADARFQRARPAVAAHADELQLPTENLLTPAYLRRVCWEPVSETEPGIAEQLRELGAREWQIAQTTPVIATAFVEARQASQEDSADAR